MLPVGHPKMVAGRCPFPVAAVCGIIKTVEREQIMALYEVDESCLGDIRRAGSPATAVKTFQPDARAQIKMRNRGCDLVFDEVFLQIRLITSGTAHPALSSEIITKFRQIFASSAVVAAVDHTTARVPVVNRFEITFFAEGDHHIAVVQSDLNSFRTDILKQCWQFGDDIIPLTLLKFMGKILVP